MLLRSSKRARGHGAITPIARTLIGVQTMRCAWDHSCDRFLRFPYENGINGAYTLEPAGYDVQKFVMPFA
jgi:hypothetical protein